MRGCSFRYMPVWVTPVIVAVPATPAASTWSVDDAPRLTMKPITATAPPTTTKMPPISSIAAAGVGQAAQGDGRAHAEDHEEDAQDDHVATGEAAER